ncbi:RNase H domain-containing protein [Trichonephila clavipes]|uniref:RNase H domain-containing protein n=1 Tax=Trichonephila clavipes TaxID=2585209 RepID=A0A8X6SGE0_TRICX|nr:RNase H domain-containing protein [Trichonephila clavipes]
MYVKPEETQNLFIGMPIIHPTFIELAIYWRQHQQEYSSPFQQLSDLHPIHLQWVPSHVGLLGNEVADDLAKVATSNLVDPEDHMVLHRLRSTPFLKNQYAEPPVQPWYFQRHPGSVISFKGSRSYQTAFSRFSTGHLRCMNFEGVKEVSQFAPNVTSALFLLSTFCNVCGFRVRRVLHPPCCS